MTVDTAIIMMPRSRRVTVGRQMPQAAQAPPGRSLTKSLSHFRRLTSDSELDSDGPVPVTVRDSDGRRCRTSGRSPGERRRAGSVAGSQCRLAMTGMMEPEPRAEPAGSGR